MGVEVNRAPRPGRARRMGRTSTSRRSTPDRDEGSYRPGTRGLRPRRSWARSPSPRRSSRSRAARPPRTNRSRRARRGPRPDLRCNTARRPARCSCIRCRDRGRTRLGRRALPRCTWGRSAGPRHSSMRRSPRPPRSCHRGPLRSAQTIHRGSRPWPSAERPLPRRRTRRRTHTTRPRSDKPKFDESSWGAAGATRVPREGSGAGLTLWSDCSRAACDRAGAPLCRNAPRSVARSCGGRRQHPGDLRLGERPAGAREDPAETQRGDDCAMGEATSAQLGDHREHCLFRLVLHEPAPLDGAVAMKASAGVSPFAVPSAETTRAPPVATARSIVAATYTSRASRSRLATTSTPAPTARSSPRAATRAGRSPRSLPPLTPWSTCQAATEKRPAAAARSSAFASAASTSPGGSALGPLVGPIATAGRVLANRCGTLRAPVRAAPVVPAACARPRRSGSHARRCRPPLPRTRPRPPGSDSAPDFAPRSLSR